MTTIDCNLNDVAPQFNKKYDHLIDQVIETLKQKLSTDEYAGTYYEEHLKNLTQNHWVRRYLVKKKGDIQQAADSMIPIMHFMKKHKVYELKENDFAKEGVMLGSAFFYEPDLQGRRVFYFRCRFTNTNKDLLPLLQQYVAFLLDKAAVEAGEVGTTTVVDFSRSWSRVSVSWIKFFAEIIPMVPYSSGQILLVDLPTIAQGAYKLIKYALPADERDVIRVVSREQLTDFIDINNLPKYLGGKCEVPYDGPLCIPKGSPWLVDHLRANGLKNSQIKNAFVWYRKEIADLREECSWANQDLLDQMDATLLRLDN